MEYLNNRTRQLQALINVSSEYEGLSEDLCSSAEKFLSLGRTLDSGTLLGVCAEVFGNLDSILVAEVRQVMSVFRTLSEF